MAPSNNAALNGKPILSAASQAIRVGRPGRSLPSQSRSFAPLPSTKWAVVLLIASIIAIATSGYLAYVGLTSSKIAGCGDGPLFNCGHVTSSRWSLWLGIPVSLLAVGLYVALVSSLFVGANKRFSKSTRQLGWASTSVFAIAAGLSAVWFVSLQVFVLNHLCTYCLVAHACGLVAASIVVWQKPIGFINMKTISAFSVAGAAVLIAGQLATEAPKTYQIEQFEASAAGDAEVFEFEAPAPPAANSTDAPEVTMNLPSIHEFKQALTAMLIPAAALNLQVAQPATPTQSEQQTAETETEQDKPAERRLVAINGGTVQLDAAQWPLVGSKSAKHIFVEMFDYSCPHCRSTHAAIKSAKEKLDGKLAVVALPVPLNAACNGSIQTTNPSFTESCEISKLAIAVWRVDPVKFTAFHNWMFASEKAPTYQGAKAHAEKLVNAEKLNKVINSDVPRQYIAKTTELYRRAGKGTVPKLIFPTTSVVGLYTSADGLVEIIKQQSK